MWFISQNCLTFNLGASFMKMRRMQIYFDKRLYEQLKLLSRERGVTLSGLIREILWEYLTKLTIRSRLDRERLSNGG